MTSAFIVMDGFGTKEEMMVTTVRIVNLRSSHAIPIAVRDQLEGLVVSTTNPDRIQVVTKPTVGNEAAVAGYETLNDECYVLSRTDLLSETDGCGKEIANTWLKTLEVDLLFFCKSCCEEV